MIAGPRRDHDEPKWDVFGAPVRGGTTVAIVRTTIALRRGRLPYLVPKVDHLPVPDRALLRYHPTPDNLDAVTSVIDQRGGHGSALAGFYSCEEIKHRWVTAG